jgi:periplasmic copper chaperone A
MRTAFSKHAIASTLATMTVVLVAGGIAAAHVDPDPVAMEAGSTGTVSFKIEHGCDGSPTVDMNFKIPAGVTGVAAVAKDGWTATVTADTLEFKGGSIPADQEDHFDITFTAPTQPGDIRFPVIQTCQQGELAWIEVPAEGAAEPEHPAPTLKITSGPPTSADLTPVPDATDAPTDTVVTSATVISTTAVAPPADDSSNTGAIVAVVIVAAAVVVGGSALLIRRNKAATPKT